MNIPRLIHLRDVVIPSIPPSQFNMEAWTDPTPECGTTHCLAGWAALDPTFNAQGLILNGLGSPILNNNHMLAGYSPIRIFFDLTHFESYHLFSSRWSYEDNTLAGCIHRINDLLENRLQPPE